MPAGVMGPTIMPVEHRPSIIRWHGPEWREFIKDIEGYKNRILEAQRSAMSRLRDHRQKCPKCRQAYMAMMSLRKLQRGSVGAWPQAAAAQQGAGGGDCTFTVSTVPNLFEFNVEPTNSHTQARLFTNGDWYSQAGTTTSFGSSDGTWQGGCAVADYDTRWNQISGDTENGSATVGVDGAWGQADLQAAAVGYSETNIGSFFGTFNLQCRDGSSLNILFTDGFTMDCEVETRN